MEKNKLDILSLTFEELEKKTVELGEPKYRGKQIFEWLHNKQMSDIKQMTNLPKTLQQKLSDEAELKKIKILEKVISKEDETKKYLFCLHDNNIIESVLMKYKFGNTVCISSQVGCKMGCTFCASTLDGFVRNLTISEMLLQVYEIQKDCEERISHVVIMGSGEPFENLQGIMSFIDILNHPIGLNISQRHITVSTCGLVKEMKQLADEKYKINLAVSLHAPNDAIRKKLMPIAKRYSYKEVLEGCRYYAEKTGRRVTFEYALINGINDGDEHALELAKRLKGILCHVNLIPINAVKEREFEKSSENTIKKFSALLNKKGIETTIRRELGSDINAACGQLRKRYLTKVR